MGKTRRAGARWKEGVDTCIFKPAVRCGPKEERQAGHVSRILRTDQANYDGAIEQIIEENHPELLRQKVVSVRSHVCHPYYTDTDTAPAQFGVRPGHGCARLGVILNGPGNTPNENHVNFITPEMNGTVDSLFANPAGNYTNVKNWREILAGAMDAALELVPDDGPWIIHGDCHLKNVVYWRDPARAWPVSALADWGRTLLIEDPNDLEVVKAAIKRWVIVGNKWVDPGATNDQIEQAILQFRGKGYAQLPDSILDTLAIILQPPMLATEDDRVDFRRRMNRLRGWVPYSLMIQVSISLPDRYRDELYDDSTRAGLGINDIIQQPNQERLKQYMLRIFASSPSRPAPAGGKRRKTKKHPRRK